MHGHRARLKRWRAAPAMPCIARQKRRIFAKEKAEPEVVSGPAFALVTAPQVQPSAALSASARSVRSQGNRSPSGLRPKWP